MGDTGSAGRANKAGGTEVIGGAGDRRDMTGVPYLDELLGGGILRGSLALIMGTPGSGKTTLASQIAFASARAGRTALVLTALSESTAKLIGHLGAFSFFDSSMIGGPVQFFSLQSTLENGLPALGDTIVAEARRVRAGLVMLDGFRGMRSIDVDPNAARELLYTLGTTLGALGITTIITSETDPRDPAFFPETTTADIILGLHYTLRGVRQYRGIEVIKARGSAPIPGLHALTLDTGGASIYPQLEERVALEIFGTEAQMQGAEPSTSGAPIPRAVKEFPQRASFGLPEFDEMLSGGIPRSSCTLLAGSLGTGKTLLALHYALAGVRVGEPALYLGFREDREQLLKAATPFAIGPELERALQPGGGMTLMDVPPIKVNPDVLADRLLKELDRSGARRLVIDSIAELERGIERGLDAQRLEDYLAALLRALRIRRVTALLVKETDKVLAPTLDFSADPLSPMAENVLLLQQVPYRGELHRILSILKLRFSAHDTSLREFRIAAPVGLQVLERFESQDGVLEGIASEQDHLRTALGRKERTNAPRQQARGHEEDS